MEPVKKAFVSQYGPSDAVHDSDTGEELLTIDYLPSASYLSGETNIACIKRNTVYDSNHNKVGRIGGCIELCGSSFSYVRSFEADGGIYWTLFDDSTGAEVGQLSYVPDGDQTNVQMSGATMLGFKAAYVLYTYYRKRKVKENDNK